MLFPGRTRYIALQVLHNHERRRWGCLARACCGAEFKLAPVQLQHCHSAELTKALDTLVYKHCVLMSVSVSSAQLQDLPSDHQQPTFRYGWPPQGSIPEDPSGCGCTSNVLPERRAHRAQAQRASSGLVIVPGYCCSMVPVQRSALVVQHGDAGVRHELKETRLFSGCGRRRLPASLRSRTSTR